jgi:glutamine amidotransferase
VTRIDARRVPQIGWNAVEAVGTEPLFQSAPLPIAYYANSFVCRPSGDFSRFVSGWSEHDGDRFPAAVRFREVVGVQFHPEKSSGPGVQFVRRFLERASALRNIRRGR